MRPDHALPLHSEDPGHSPDIAGARSAFVPLLSRSATGGEHRRAECFEITRSVNAEALVEFQLGVGHRACVWPITPEECTALRRRPLKEEEHVREIVDLRRRLAKVSYELTAEDAAEMAEEDQQCLG